MKFNDVVKITASSCSKKFIVVYNVPCIVDTNISLYFVKMFGKPVYPLKSIKLLKIETSDSIHIESRIGSKIVKLTMPQKFKAHDLFNIKRKIEFEKCLINWLIDTLQINIEMG